MKPRLGVESLLAILVVGVFGLAAAFIVPPLVTFDGPSHYFRALQISRGQWRADRYSARAAGGMLPSSQVAFVGRLWNGYWVDHDFGTPASWESLSRSVSGSPGTERAEFTNTAVYSPANYAPQAIGLRLASWVSPSPLLAARSAGLMNLAGYLAVVVLALQLMPRYRRGFLLLATTPLAVIQAASLSADAVNAALPLLVLAWTWRLRERDGRPGAAELSGLFCVGLVVVLLKPTAIATLTCLLLLPPRSFGGTARWAACLAVFFVCAVGVWYAWNRPNLDIDVAAWFEPARAPVSVQRAWFAARPLRFLGPFLYFLRHDLAAQWPNLYGNAGGWIPAGVQRLLGILSLAFIPGFLGCGRWEGRADRVWGAGNAVQAFVIVAFTALTLWLSLGTPSTDRIPAFSGRYLLVVAAGAGIAVAEASHRGLERVRGALFWSALAANCAGLTAILGSVASRLA